MGTKSLGLLQRLSWLWYFWLVQESTHMSISLPGLAAGQGEHSKAREEESRQE